MVGSNGSFHTSVPHGINIRVRDELVHGVVGAYHDFDSTYHEIDDVPEVFALFPADSLLGTEHPCTPESPCEGETGFSSLLDSLRWSTRSDGSDGHEYILAYPTDDQPIRAFLDSASVPDPEVLTGIRDAMARWGDSTVFLYRGVLLDRMDLFVEDATDPEAGTAFEYGGSTNSVTVNSYYPQPFPTPPPDNAGPKHETIHLDGGMTGAQEVRDTTIMLLRRVLFSDADMTRPDPAPGSPDPLEASYNGRLTRARMACQLFFQGGLVHLGCYREGE